MPQQECGGIINPQQGHMLRPLIVVLQTDINSITIQAKEIIIPILARRGIRAGNMKNIFIGLLIGLSLSALPTFSAPLKKMVSYVTWGEMNKHIATVTHEIFDLKKRMEKLENSSLNQDKKTELIINCVNNAEEIRLKAWDEICDRSNLLPSCKLDLDTVDFLYKRKQYAVNDCAVMFK